MKRPSAPFLSAVDDIRNSFSYILPARIAEFVAQPPLRSLPVRLSHRHLSPACTRQSEQALPSVTLAGSDRVAVVDTKLRKVARYLHDAAPGAPPEGSTPNAVALTSDGKRLLVAEADNNAVAVFDVATGKLLGRVPTDWYPTAIAEVGGQLLALSGKGHGTHANPDGPVPLTNWPNEKPTAYALGQLNGTLRVLSASLPSPRLASFTERVVAANNWQHRSVARRYPPFRHVVYIIKENRTYDQVLGDSLITSADPFRASSHRRPT